VRLWAQGRAYTLVVMLQLPAWNAISGDTVGGNIDTLMQHFPTPVRIQHRGHDLVVLVYEELYPH